MISFEMKIFCILIRMINFNGQLPLKAIWFKRSIFVFLIYTQSSEFTTL